MTTLPWLSAGNTATITGGADGIGKAVAATCAKHGMAVALIDWNAETLPQAAEELKAAGAAEVLTFHADVSDAAALSEIEAEIAGKLGGTDMMMNNAGTALPNSTVEASENWQKLLGVNLWGVINGTQAFAPRMIERGRPGAIINTGSKQGITTPPGNPCYNVSKAGVKAFTEALAYELRNDAPHLSAHLMVPGFVFTGLTRGDRAEKPAGAWTAEETAGFMFESLEKGDFYIICPDNDVPRELDEKRMAWAIGDIIENRPALSRWHPDYAEAFEAFVKG